MAISHVFSNQIADGTNTNIVRPSDWNSAHNQYYTLSGNTLGASTVSGTNVVFQGSGNISLSGTGRTIVIYGTGGGGGGGGGAALSAGTQSVSTGTVNFADSNGISFGMAGSNQITASYTVPTQSVQTQAAGNIAGTGFSSTTTAGTAITAALGTNGLTMAIPAYLTAAVGGGGVAVSAGTQSVSTGTVSFADSNGITFGLNNGTLTASVPSVSALSNGNNITISNTGATIGISAQAVAAAAGTQTAISGTVNFVNSNGVTFGMSGSNQITASVAGGGGGVAIGASTQTATSGTVIFSNSNGITFGLNNGTLTASAAAAPTSYVSNVNGSSGAISLNVGSSLSSSTAGSSITFGLASNITTALQSAGAYLTTAAQSSASNLSIAVAATNSTGGGTATLASSISFSNANGLTFYTSAGNAIVASYTVPTQSVQTQASGAIAGTGFTSTTTAGTAITGALGTNGLNLGVPAYLTTQSIQTQASGAIAGTGFTSATTAGSVITAALGTNGLNMGIPAYLTAAAGGVMYANLSGNTSGNTTASGSTLNFSGINLTLSGTNNSQIAISAPATSALVAGNNISLSTNGSTISVRAQAVAIGANTQTATSGTINFVNSNGITFGMSGSNQITASYTQSNQAFSASGGSSTFQTLNFANSNGVTFSNSGGSVVASYTVPATTGFAGTNTSANNASLTLNSNGLTISVAAPGAANYSIGVSNLGNTAGATGITGTRIVFVGTNNISLSQATDANGATISFDQTGGGGGVALGAGTQTATSGTVNFANSNGITFGMSGSNQITASFSQSVQTQASGNIAGLGFSSTTTAGTAIVGTHDSLGLNLGVTAYLTTQSVQTQASGAIAGTGFTTATTAGTVITGALGTNGLNLGIPAYLTAAGGGGAINVSAGTTSNNLQTVVFSNSNGVSFGLNGSTITASVAPQLTLSGYNHYNDVVQSIGAVGQGSLIFDPIDLANAVQFDRFGLMMFNSNATNSSGSHTLSFWIGLYTRSISTLSLFQSTSTTIAVTHSGTAGSYSLYSGVRQLTIPFTTTLSANAYWLGVVSRTTSGGANGSYSQLQQSNLNSDYRGFWGSAVNATNQISVGQGLYTVTTTGLPGSVAFSQINGTAAVAFRPPVVIFQSGTV